MVIERHLFDRIDMTLFAREALYGAGSALSAPRACQMQDYDDASPHVTWDDVVQANTDVVTGEEFPTHQEIARQSMTMTYTEPRTKPNTIAGLLALAMGGIPQATKASGAQAWRHQLTIGAATELPSIAVRTQYDLGVYHPPQGTQPATGTIWRYNGVKCSTMTLSNNGAYWQLAATLMGSGRRDPVGPSGLVPVNEHWLRWGDTKLYLRPLTSGVLTVPTTPTQRSANLVGGSTSGVIDLSCLVRSFSLTINNNLSADAGYRACSGLYRQQLHGTRREITGEMTFDIDNRYELQALQNYLQQYNMGLEIDCTSSELVRPGGTMYFGFSLMLPAARLTQVTRGQQDQLDNLTYAFLALDDRVNAPLYAWVWNQRPQYLG